MHTASYLPAFGFASAFDTLLTAAITIEDAVVLTIASVIAIPSTCATGPSHTSATAQATRSHDV